MKSHQAKDYNQELVKIIEKKEWDAESFLRRIKKDLKNSFIESASLLVHARQIDTKTKKEKFCIPQKNIYDSQNGLFDRQNVGFDLSDFIIRTHNHPDSKNGKISFQHFLDGVKKSLLFYFSADAIDALDLNVCGEIKYSPPKLTNREHDGHKLHSMTITGLPLSMLLSSMLNQKKKFFKGIDKKDELPMDKIKRIEIQTAFLVYCYTSECHFFENNSLKIVFNEDGGMTSKILSICWYLYELYHLIFYCEQNALFRINYGLSQYIFDFVQEQFILLLKELSFNKGIIFSKVERALLNQKSPTKAVNKKAKLMAEMIIDKAYKNDADLLEIKGVDLYKIFNHGDISITSHPTEKKYLKLSEEILNKKIQII